MDKKRSFTIKCDDCGSEVTIKDNFEMYQKPIEIGTFSFRYDTHINLGCGKCNNEATSKDSIN